MKTQRYYLDVHQLGEVMMKYLKVKARQDKTLFYVAFMLLTMTYVNIERKIQTTFPNFSCLLKKYIVI